ncbi:hypothetical protein N7456_000548 [Penicillium angulare]|uniref:Uncharacterized protein n=1 Tax=Penicillium angulare TaxID=116970 RepID=A0A9W9GD91_9EURO|nr:hypothetical protein N7456_000548 [Penicillium angulare]
MAHSITCDCSRCWPPEEFYRRPETRHLRYSQGAERKRQTFEIRQAQEARAFRKIFESDSTVLYLRLGNVSDPSTPDQEVKSILDDVLYRFGQAKKYFTPYEIQIAYIEWRHHLLQGEIPPSILSRLVMGALIDSAVSEIDKKEINDLLKNDDDIHFPNIPLVLTGMATIYGRWEEQVDDSWMVRFSPDRTARLTKLLPGDEEDKQDEEVDEEEEAEEEEKEGEEEEEEEEEGSLPDDFPDSVLREIMQRNQPDEKKDLPGVFNSYGGSHIGRVRPPYWPVALATQPSGHRYLSDALLNQILPFWEELLKENNSRTVKYYMEKWQHLKPEFENWMQKEKFKLRRKGITDWPAPYSGLPENMGSAESPSDVWDKVYEVKANNKPPGVLSSSKSVQARGRRKQPLKTVSAGSTHQPRDSGDQPASRSVTQLLPAARTPLLDQSSKSVSSSEATLREIQASLHGFVIEQRSSLAEIHSKIDNNDHKVEKRLRGIEERMLGSNSRRSGRFNGSSSPGTGHSSPSRQDESSTPVTGLFSRK